MMPVANLTGCSLSLGTLANTATISCEAGSVHFVNGYVLKLLARSISVDLRDKPRRIRLFATGVHSGTLIPPVSDGLPGPFFLGDDSQGQLGVDDDQSTQRGMYPAGLLVLGYIDLPAKPSDVSSEKENEKALNPRERNNLLRVIRALCVMSKLPRSGYAESIRQQLLNLGMTAPSDDTIRKAVEAAHELDS